MAKFYPNRDDAIIDIIEIISDNTLDLKQKIKSSIVLLKILAKKFCFEV